MSAGSSTISQCFFISMLLLLCACESRAKEPCHEVLKVNILATTKYDTEHDATMKYDTEHDVTMKYDTEHDVTMKYDTEHDATMKYDNQDDVTMKYDTEHDVTMKYDTEHDMTIKYDTEHEATMKYGTEQDVTMKYDTEQDATMKHDNEHDVTMKYDTEHDVTMKYDTDHDVTMKYDQSHPSSHKNHIDPSIMVFFHLKDLKVGNKIPIYFPKRDSSKSPPFLSKEEADTIPFSSKKLPALLHYFSIPPSSPQAKAIENTLRHCEAEPIKGETKHCATSLESMLDFAQSIFGLEKQFEGLNTVYIQKPTKVLQNYTVLKSPLEMSPFKMVACHILPYPYTVYYCHSLEGETKVFKVSLGGENGVRVKAVAVCHMDTSNWGRNHVSFRLLGIEPGTSPVCHFFPAENTVWIPRPNSAKTAI